MADSEIQSVEGKRVVKGLVIGKTLGKGTFGFVKLGTKEETGHQFALKFLYTKNKNYNEESVKKEIECMKKVRHPNVVALLASTMKCKYPNTEGGFDQTCLMVMEYANGGDLYDIIYYAGAMDEQLGRTYFKQLLDGVGAIHAEGITHRDLKPNNILIDSKFVLKITDFGLSHIGGDQLEDPNQKRMKTTWVGTRGYRAPELVLKARYSNQADVFALGVCLFVMLCARQPFKVASANDPWYKCIATRQFDKYWRSHKSSALSDDAKEFLQGLMCYQPRDRTSVKAAYEQAWMKGDMHEVEELPTIMHKKHSKANQEKLKDPERKKRLQQSAPGEKRGDSSEFRKQVDALGAQCPTIEYIPIGAICMELVKSDEKYFAADRLQDVKDWCKVNLKATFKNDPDGPLTTQATYQAESSSGNASMGFNLAMAVHDGHMILMLTFDAGENQHLIDTVKRTVLDGLHKPAAFQQFYEPMLKVKEIKNHDDFDFSVFDEAEEEDVAAADS